MAYNKQQQKTALKVLFFAQGQKKPWPEAEALGWGTKSSVGGQSPPQELEVSWHCQSQNLLNSIAYAHRWWLS